MENDRWIVSELRRLDEKMNEREKLVESRFTGHEKALTVAKEDQKEALNIAKDEMERRMDATKNEFNLTVKNITEKIDDLQVVDSSVRMTSASYKGEKKWTDYLTIAIIAALISVAIRFLVK
uniref:Uncharacterized protein n=1 Tax=viral metagenome TaxID=1070528 RepID=A0A6M3IJR0_9ZZZZ